MEIANRHSEHGVSVHFISGLRVWISLYGVCHLTSFTAVEIER